MPLGTEVGLGPEDIVLFDIRFILYFIVHMCECHNFYLVNSYLRTYLLDGDPAPAPPKKGAEPPPQFSAMSVVAKRLHGSRWHLAWRWALVQATLC